MQYWQETILPKLKEKDLIDSVLGLKPFNFLINTLGDKKGYKWRIYSLNLKTTSNLGTYREEQYDDYKPEIILKV